VRFEIEHREQIVGAARWLFVLRRKAVDAPSR